MAQILDIQARNYMSFALLEFDFQDLGLCAIKGINIDANADSNGAGKSHLLGVLYWALYGKTLREVSSADVVKRNSTGGAWGKLRFKNNRKQILVVERYLRHPKYKNNLYFYPEGAANPYSHPLRGADKHETQNNIIKEINMSRDLFRQIITFGPEGMTRFSQLTDAGQKKLLEEVLHVFLYEYAAALARKQISDLGKKKKEYEFQTTQIKSHLHQLEKTLRKIERDESLMAKQKASKLQSLENDKKSIEIKLAKLSSISLVDDAPLRETLLQKQEELLAINSTYNQQLEEKRKHNTILAIDIEKIRAEYRRVQQELHRLQELLQKKVCPECYQEVESQAFPKSLNILQQELDSLTQQGKTTRQHIEYANAQIERLTEVHRKQENLLSTGIAQLHESIEKAQMHNKSLQQKLREKDRLNIEMENFEWKINEASKQETSLRHQREAIQEELAEEKKKESRILSKIDKANLTEGQHKVLEQVFGPKGIRSYLFETILPEFNDRLQYYCNIVANGHLNAALSVTSKKQDGGVSEKISLRVQNMDGIISYRSCSSGEKRRLDLPIAFALQDVAARRGASLGLCILDEVFENLDETGKDGIMMLLRDIARRPHTGTVLLISHDKDLETSFSNVISVRKRNGTSQIIKKSKPDWPHVA